MWRRGAIRVTFLVVGDGVCDQFGVWGGYRHVRCDFLCFVCVTLHFGVHCDPRRFLNARPHGGVPCAGWVAGGEHVGYRGCGVALGCACPSTAAIPGIAKVTPRPHSNMYLLQGCLPEPHNKHARAKSGPRCGQCEVAIDKAKPHASHIKFPIGPLGHTRSHEARTRPN